MWGLAELRTWAQNPGHMEAYEVGLRFCRPAVLMSLICFLFTPELLTQFSTRAAKKTQDCITHAKGFLP